MDDQAQTSPAISTTSGGVSIEAQGDVNVGGDVVGRDKIVQVIVSLFDWNRSKFPKWLQYDIYSDETTILSMNHADDKGLLWKTKVDSAPLQVVFDQTPLYQPHLSQVILTFKNNGPDNIEAEDFRGEPLVLDYRGKATVVGVIPNPANIECEPGPNADRILIKPQRLAAGAVVKLAVYLTDGPRETSKTSFISFRGIASLPKRPRSVGNIGISKKMPYSYQISYARLLLFTLGLPCGGLWLLGKVLQAQPEIFSSSVPIWIPSIMTVAIVVLLWDRLRGNRRRSSGGDRPPNELGG